MRGRGQILNRSLFAFWNIPTKRIDSPTFNFRRPMMIRFLTADAQLAGVAEKQYEQDHDASEDAAQRGMQLGSKLQGNAAAQNSREKQGNKRHQEHVVVGQHDDQQGHKAYAASYALAQQYITALLNIASPADPAAVLEDLKHASAWFQQIPLGSRPGNPEQKAGLQIADSLEAYNLGFTGPGSCAADQPVVTPTQAFTPTSTFPPTPTFAPTMAPTLAPTLVPTVTPAAAQTLPTPTATP